MTVLESGTLLLRLFLSGLFVAFLYVPYFRLTGSLRQEWRSGALRGLVAGGLLLVSFLSFVNLAGKALGNAIAALWIFIALHLLLWIWLWKSRRWNPERSGGLRLGQASSRGIHWRWRHLWLPLLAGCALALPQWLLAVSTNYWDEAASSAIHWTAPNQFAEGIFPPRHNAFPDIAIKYHYAFTMLSGTVRWLTGLSSNVSVGVASTALWLFIFLFLYFWLEDLSFPRPAALWGATMVLLGGGLSWIYVGWLETHRGFSKSPGDGSLIHRFEPAKGWLENLIEVGRNQTVHLRNADGTYSILPFEVTNYFQQHAVPVGIAGSLIAVFLFSQWRRRESSTWILFFWAVLSFSVLFLCHVVFAAVVSVSAGLMLLASGLLQPERRRFLEGLGFTLAVTVVAFLHGGFFSFGAEYGAGGVATLREQWGFSEGGWTGFLHWNLAGFGVPLLLALSCLLPRQWRLFKGSEERWLAFRFLALVALLSYAVPHLLFYSSESSSVEQFTEVSKFFFCTRLALALLSGFAVCALLERRRWGTLVPLGLAAVVSPLIFCFAGSFDNNKTWVGFYRSPYEYFPGSPAVQMGRRLAQLKNSNRDVYFDASADERRSGYLNELLIYGGSVFTMTPSRYERTGVGYRLAEDRVAGRFLQNGRMMRLRPGAAEEAGCDWFYARPQSDFSLRPPIIRSRFDKLVAEGYFQEESRAGDRVLYSIRKPTRNLDDSIHRYWKPRLVTQTQTDWEGDGRSDLIFYDYERKKILAGAEEFPMPTWLGEEFVQLWVGSFPGDPRVDFLFARMEDTVYRASQRIEELLEYNGYQWSYADSFTRNWQAEYGHWFWDLDVPAVGDTDGDGFDTLLAYRPSTGQWLSPRNQALAGPNMPESDLPLPFAGRFLQGSAGDLGLWSQRTGLVKIRSLTLGTQVEFYWGGRDGDVLLPGDFDGDGDDEIGIWQRSSNTWFWKSPPDGEVSQAVFGSDSGIPVPADYNQDGRLDLAIWEPEAGTIEVSFSAGRSVDLVVPVPPGTLPAFVNMY